MLIAVLAFATSMAAVWFALMGMVTKEDWVAAAYNKILDNMASISRLRRKDEANREKLAQYHGVAGAVMKIFIGGGSEKEIAELEKQNGRLKKGNLRHIGIFVMPGYVLLRRFDAIGKSGIHKTILIKNTELYGKKHAENKTKQLLAKLLSYPIIGVASSFMLGAVVMGFSAMAGIAILSIGTVLVLVLIYAMYDEISDKTNKRRAAIARQFPNMASKLALLVTSGMIMARAWKETAYSQESELYMEMRKTSEELDNLVSPEAAYGAFINRCNTKETSKFASAVMQNLSKGNAEIGVLLKELAKEAWQERRHTAKRDSEKANSKLMIPTMLLFLAILIIIMVPVAMNFSSL